MTYMNKRKLMKTKWNKRFKFCMASLCMAGSTRPLVVVPALGWKLCWWYWWSKYILDESFVKLVRFDGPCIAFTVYWTSKRLSVGRVNELSSYMNEDKRNDMLDVVLFIMAVCSSWSRYSMRKWSWLYPTFFDGGNMGTYRVLYTTCNGE